MFILLDMLFKIMTMGARLFTYITFHFHSSTFNCLNFSTLIYLYNFNIFRGNQQALWDPWSDPDMIRSAPPWFTTRSRSYKHWCKQSKSSAMFTSLYILNIFERNQPRSQDPWSDPYPIQSGPSIIYSLMPTLTTSMLTIQIYEHG